MDTSEYMPMFLAESREHLEQLNLVIVRLEEDPKDQSTVEEIFRIAHSFKGMSATMGFAKIAELTHNMEDVFELRLTIHRHSGDISNWKRVNRRFLNTLRKQFLIWRTLRADERERYFEEAEAAPAPTT